MRSMTSTLLLLFFLLASAAAQEGTAPALDISALRARAEAGDAKAQVQLGRAYEDGVGVNQNENEAARWYRKAAEAGDADGQTELGLAYRLGRGVDKDLAEAVRWYEKAARQGNAKAMFNLGTHYYNGDGVTIDDLEAYMWFELARRAGSKPAIGAVERMQKELSPGRLVDGKFQLAGVLAAGNKVPRDTNTAIALYEEVASYERPEVQLALAKIFMNGWGVPQNGAKAQSYCGRALELQKNYVPGMLCLAYLEQTGILGTRREREAAIWYEKAFKAGSVIAAYALGTAYATGSGVKQDLAKAFELLSLASRAKIPAAVQLANEVEQRLPPEVAKKIMKKTNEKPTWMYVLGPLDKEFPYAVKVEHLP